MVCCKLFLRVVTLVVNVILNLLRWERLIVLRFQWYPQCLIRTVRIVERPLYNFLAIVTTSSRIVEEIFELSLGQFVFCGIQSGSHAVSTVFRAVRSYKIN